MQNATVEDHLAVARHAVGATMRFWVAMHNDAMTCSRWVRLLMLHISPGPSRAHDTRQ